MNYNYDNMCVRNMISLELNLYESSGCFSFLKTQSFLFFFSEHDKTSFDMFSNTISTFLYSPLFSFKNINENFVQEI